MLNQQSHKELINLLYHSLWEQKRRMYNGKFSRN
nr:MAG TPA: hypothetical protein [Caudoviricetes sp.]